MLFNHKAQIPEYKPASQNKPSRVKNDILTLGDATGLSNGVLHDTAFRGGIGARSIIRPMPDHNPAPIAAPDAAPHRPLSKTDLFLSFNWLALQGFGGVLAVVQRELVEKKRWMTREQFVEDWAVAQIMPGPNVVNLSLMIGGRYFGLAGALAAWISDMGKRAQQAPDHDTAAAPSSDPA